ncbi:hybrid sensor histidine kinase/response regulator [Propionivibrio limicola]|uniref:hybrid sensor histidine kinase/response regulator n=1 Tax=Propionivibrio limicola TaxID=167645 RepID=UPI0012923CAC|nr:response regulator [Propionivibrio limicola]
MLQLLRHYRKSVFTFLLFIAYAGAVFWSNYDSLQQLQANAQLQFRMETEKQASAIAYFFSERRNDIEGLAESSVITNFFVNHDLGMSYQYGLGVNVQLIEDNFERLAGHRRVGAEAPYTGLLLVDNTGDPVASWNAPEIPGALRKTLFPGNSPDHRSSRTLLGDRTGEILITAPVWMNDAYRGELIAWIDADTSLAQFGQTGTSLHSVLVDRRNGSPLRPGSDLAKQLAQYPPEKNLLTPAGVSNQASLHDFGPDHVLARVEIKNTPLAFVSVSQKTPVNNGMARLFVIAAAVVPLIVILVAFLDALERRRLEHMQELARREAERLAKARSEFLANMSHEIRTPMNAIIGLAELCLATQPDRKQRNYLTKIQRASNSLLRIVNDILDYSKIESGKLGIEQVPFDLDQVLDDLSAIFSERAGKKSIELVFDTDDSCHRNFIGDPLRIEQILINLIGNAIKFSDQGTIAVRLRCEAVDECQTRLNVEVIDEGIGLSRNQLNRLFSAFAQADTTTTRRYGGTGLGLVISKRLVELMGGRIRVKSESGKGSNFRFYITLGVGSGDEAPLDLRRRNLSPHASKPVLLIDDNPLCRTTLASQLKRLGLDAEIHASGAEALRAVMRASAPDYLVALVDHQMPGLNGVETIERLKTFWQNKHPAPPIILMTDLSHKEAEAATSLSDSLLLKPVTSSRLFAEIAPLIGIEYREESAEANGMEADISGLNGLDILLVDDAPLNQEVVRDMLVNAGVQVRIAKNGREAIEFIRRQRPDGVLMDCQMPVMDGYEATRQLREDARYRDLPIIALTANVLQTEKERCMQAGMNDYLSKPVSSRALYTVLASAIDKTRTPRAIVPGDTAPSAANALDLPELRGIDSQLGLRYANGKPVLYRKLLKLFHDTHGREFESGFKSALSKDEWDTATRLAHSLKSAAKTIGAIDLGNLAKTLEDACREREADTIPGILERLLNEMRNICDGLSTIAPEQ